MYGSRLADMNGLYQFVYASRAVHSPGWCPEQGLVADILRSSIPNNQASGLTGALLFCSGWFLQTLEGRRVDASVTYRRIETDPRHRDLRLIACGPLAARRFGHWSMCARVLTPADKAIVEVLDGSTRFDPPNLRPDQAIGILQAVARLQPAQPPPGATPAPAPRPVPPPG